MAYSPPWTTPGSATAIYSVLAFLSITITICSVSVRRTNPTPSNDVFVGGLAYASIIFGGAAIFYVFTAETAASHINAAGVFQNLIALATTGIAMFVYSYLCEKTPDEDSRWSSRMLTPGIVIVGLLSFAIFLVISRMQLPEIIVLAAGYIAGSVAVVTYVAAGYFALVHKAKSSFDSRRMAISFFLLAGASLNHVILLPNPSALWLISIALMGTSLIIAIVATGFPFLKQIGIEEHLAYRITITISALVILPYIAVHLIETTFIMTTLVDIGGTVLVHAAGFVFAISFAYALYTKSKLRTAPYQTPIIILLLYWSIAELALVFWPFFALPGMDSESLMPYIIGGFVSIVNLAIASRRLLNPPTDYLIVPTKKLYIALASLFSIMIYSSESLYRYAFQTGSFLIDLPLTIGLLLSLSFLSLFVLLNFIILLTGVSGGNFSFDAVAAGSTTIWLVVMTLKANFATWTAGWWAAEALMAIVFATFPIIIMRYYLEESSHNVVFRERAEIYSKYLTDLIRIHNQRTINVLGDSDEHSKMSEGKLDAVSRAMQEVTRADDIARNMTSMIVASRMPEDDLEPIDLVSAIHLAASRIETEKELEAFMTINKKKGDCFVLANVLLSDAFYHLFLGTANRLGYLFHIVVEINPENEQPKSNWYLTISLKLAAAEKVGEENLFSRYTERVRWTIFEFGYAQRIMELFSGYIQAGKAVYSNDQLTVSFEIILPASRILEEGD
ncbi:MAG: hypothetical protein P1Q69_10100 [Candidatus Thorarchaeota archaeon]|nr:hypothetical protein [Candidatus Thorarchaeota archaeon]